MDTVRIHDLADPEFSPEVREVLAAMGTMAPTDAFDPDVLLEAASKQSGGLSDFGDPWFGSHWASCARRCGRRRG